MRIWLGQGAIIGIAAVIASATTAIPAERLVSMPRASSAAAESGTIRAPRGWIDFCGRHSQDCTRDTAEPERIDLTPRFWRKLVAVNSAINARLQPLADMTHWGLTESWDYPDDGKGDCEDYALEKRRRLIAAGFPQRVLLMTVVLDEAGQGHAVLLVRTDRGDLVLDNKRDAIFPWSATGYTFIKRESQSQSGWVALGNAVGHTATATFVP
ncbi:transglutaminase-like cysteine peptidase [Chelatococcus sp. GCM10030263]|uniref:transglutaminase-like cysteine peptidase n=1 Tax=Chelatococcus sp. GCM10030263 TaxID=3273387 RepID=UPI00361C35A9